MVTACREIKKHVHIQTVTAVVEQGPSLTHGLIHTCRAVICSTQPRPADPTHMPTEFCACSHVIAAPSLKLPQMWMKNTNFLLYNALSIDAHAHQLATRLSWGCPKIKLDQMRKDVTGCLICTTLSENPHLPRSPPNLNTENTHIVVTDEVKTKELFRNQRQWQTKQWIPDGDQWKTFRVSTD